MKLFFLFFISILVNVVSANEVEKKSTIAPEKVYDISFSVIKNISKCKKIKDVLPYPLFVNFENMSIVFKEKRGVSYRIDWKENKWNVKLSDDLNILYSIKDVISFFDIKKCADCYILKMDDLFDGMKIYSIEFKSKESVVLFVADKNMEFSPLKGGGDIYKCIFVKNTWKVECVGGYDM